MFRIYNIVDPSAPTKVDVNKLVPPHMLSFSEKGVKTVHAYRKWWNETGNAKAHFLFMQYRCLTFIICQKKMARI